VQVKIDKPILRIPMLAIHLNRTIRSDGFKPNEQTELVPILATAAAAQLGSGKDVKHNDNSGGGSGNGSAAPPPSRLLELLASEAGCSPSDVVDMELNVCDTQPGQIGGACDEFVFVGRLDNLAMSWCCMQVRPSIRPVLRTGCRPLPMCTPTSVATLHMSAHGLLFMHRTCCGVHQAVSRALAGGTTSLLCRCAGTDGHMQRRRQPRQ
jgi:Aminopeptidase I zinc metalloprotease (M18)